MDGRPSLCFGGYKPRTRSPGLSVPWSGVKGSDVPCHPRSQYKVAQTGNIVTTNGELKMLPVTDIAETLVMYIQYLVMYIRNFAMYFQNLVKYIRNLVTYI
jgi:hypothetical protein